MNKKSLIALAIAAILANGLIAATLPESSAANKTASVTATKDSSTQKEQKAADLEAIKLSENAAITMTNVHNARVAIFNGEPGEARTYIDAAVTRVLAANKDAEKFKTTVKDDAAKTDIYVPYGTVLALADDYAVSKSKAAHHIRTNKHVQHNDKSKPADKLKLEDEGLMITSSLLPVKFAEAQIKQASELVGQGKYYQANLKLKSIEDAVIINTVALDEMPKAKDKS